MLELTKNQYEKLQLSLFSLFHLGAQQISNHVICEKIQTRQCLPGKPCSRDLYLALFWLHLVLDYFNIFPKGGERKRKTEIEKKKGKDEKRKAVQCSQEPSESHHIRINRYLRTIYAININGDAPKIF